MSSQNEAQHAGDWLKWEQDNLFSREKVTLLEGDGSAVRELASGHVLGKITASGKYIELTEGASDGSQTPAAILLLETVVPANADAEGTVIIRDAIVSRNGLTWPSTYSSGDIDTAVGTLKNLGILVRDGA